MKPYCRSAHSGAAILAIFSCILLASAAGGIERRRASSDSPIASIQSGKIRGLQIDLPDAPHPVNKFLGVPFAVSPPTRFALPQPAANFASVYEATAWKPACVQQFLYPKAVQEFSKALFNQPPGQQESEDCLYLNVYAPATAPPPGGFAVLFWLYGGSNQFGTASQPFYDGSAFAAYQDIIVVVPNYRTNVFGFPNSPEVSQNAGLHDQRLALEWVRDNIAAFGGDSNKVTIAGESAGAYDVDYMLTLPDKLPFRAAILQSGQAGFTAANETADRSKSWDLLVEKVGCTNAASSLACVRNVDAARIKQVTEENILAFFPVADEATVPSDLADERATGAFARVPILSGTTTQEGTVFAFGSKDVDTYLQTRLEPFQNEFESIRRAYPSSAFGSEYDRLVALVTDLIFTCPQGHYTNQTTRFNVPVWGYIYNASFPNTAWSDASGAYHSSEINIVWQTYPDGPVLPRQTEPWGLLRTNLPSTAEQKRLAKEMNAVWADFINNPFSGLGWERLQSNGLGGMRVFGNEVGKLVQAGEVQMRCSVLRPIFCAYSPSREVCA